MAGLQVIGAGCGRTGTASLQKALNDLGYGTYHMFENIKNNNTPMWIEAAKTPATYDYSKIFDAQGFTATVDFPASTFFVELLARYPDAQVVLSVRSPESWAKSVLDTIWSAEGLERHPVVKKDDVWGPFQEMCELYRARMLGDAADKINIDDPAELAKAFEAWNAKVKETVPTGKLLIFEAKDGWGPLCKFLGKPIPSEPYPNVNDTEEFKAMTAKLIGELKEKHDRA